MAVSVKWDAAALNAILKNSPEIGAELVNIGGAIAAANDAEARKHHHKPLPSGAMYVCDHRVLSRTQVAVVHSTNKVAAAIGRKYGYPRKTK